MSFREIKLFFIIKGKSLNFSFICWECECQRLESHTSSRFECLLLFFQKLIFVWVLSILVFLENEKFLAVSYLQPLTLPYLHHTKPFFFQFFSVVCCFFLNTFMRNVFQGMCLFQTAVGISVGIASITRMKETTKKLIHGFLFLRVTVH